MLAFFASIWNGFLNFLGFLLPIGERSFVKKLGPGLRLFLHLLILILVVIGLYFLNPFVAKPSLLRSRIAQDWFLPAVFLLLYAAVWTGWWLWKLLVAEGEVSRFPDIDAAWEDAMQALAREGISIQDWPLFLVLGRAESGEENLFHAGQLQLKVRQTPADSRAPIHVYADRDAVYVTCPGASLLGKQASILALEGIDEGGETVSAGGEEDPLTKTLRPGQKEKRVIRMLAQAGGQINTLIRRDILRQSGLVLPELIRNTRESELLSARLAHLCRLIARDRQPWCPINGILLLVPLGATDTEGDAQQTAEICRRDLATVRAETKVDCPLFSLVCDLEDLPGFREFIGRHDARELQRRLGQRFPLATDLNGEHLYEKIENSIEWMCGSMMRDWVYRLFRVETHGQDPAQVVAGNTRLYLFLDEMNKREKRLARILTHGLSRNADAPLLYGGCYMGATGKDRGIEQAFVAGVFRRLNDSQAFVSWTKEALVEDARNQRMAQLGYFFMGIGGLAALLISGWYLIKQFGR